MPHLSSNQQKGEYMIKVLLLSTSVVVAGALMCGCGQANAGDSSQCDSWEYAVFDMTTDVPGCSWTEDGAGIYRDACTIPDGWEPIHAGNIDSVYVRRCEY